MRGYIWLPVTNDTKPWRYNLSGGYLGSPTHPLIWQPISSTPIWGFDSAIFKSFSIAERAKLRVQADFFNTTNTPGNAFNGGASTGVARNYGSQNDARVLQLSMRLTW